MCGASEAKSKSFSWRTLVYWSRGAHFIDEFKGWELDRATPARNETLRFDISRSAYVNDLSEAKVSQGSLIKSDSRIALSVCVFVRRWVARAWLRCTHLA